MSPAEMEALVQRLVANPHDQDAITAAHRAGQSDPRAYATLLEKVGNKTADPAFSSHWLSEAANVWSTTLGDAHRAARALMQAVDRDPANSVPAERLATLYRDKGDVKALVALLERRSKALTPLAQDDPNLRPTLAALHEELGRLWSEAPLSQPRKAIDHYRRAIDQDATSQYAIYGLRELYKAERRWADAIPYFEMEQRLVSDPERQLALYLDEADVRSQAGDRVGAAEALRSARAASREEDPTLKQQIATLTLERIQANESVGDAEKREAAQLFVELAETYPGEHGFSYSSCALQVDPAHDRAAQLALYYAQQLHRETEIAPFVAAYAVKNPDGIFASDARTLIAGVVEKGDGDESLLQALVPPSNAANAERLTALLGLAHALTRKGRRREALEKYEEVLRIQPSNEEALRVVVASLKQNKKYAELRDVWLDASRDPESDIDSRKEWLREAAALCEQQLRDNEGALTAWRELVALDPLDDAPRAELRRLLERAGRWDELAELLQEDAEQTSDVEARLVIEKTLAKIHETQRKDWVAAGEAWGRIAGLSPDDADAIWTAVRLLERGSQPDFAMAVIEDNVGSISGDAERANLYAKLGELRLSVEQPSLAGAAFAEAAGLTQSDKLWAQAETCFVSSEEWGQAAAAANERGRIAVNPDNQASFLVLEAEYLTKAGDTSAALARLEQAAERAPENATIAKSLEENYRSSSRFPELVSYLLRRASAVSAAGLRVDLRKRAAGVQREELADLEGARQSLKLALEDSDDPEALLALADDAEQFGDNEAAVDYLHRLANVSEDTAIKVKTILREAGIVAGGLSDAAGAIKRYEAILKKFDADNEQALSALGELQATEGNPKAASEALERLLEITKDTARQVEVAEKLADLYEESLSDPESAIRALNKLRELDPEDYGALQRLCDLEKQVEDWPHFAEHLAELLEVEGDPEEISRMTRERAKVLHVHCKEGTEALAALEAVADEGDVPCREDYVKLGDELGWAGIVATKLVEWHFTAAHGSERDEALRGAFHRFVEVERLEDAARVGKELARTRGADASVAEKLEKVALRVKDLEALHIAHDIAVESLTGPARAEEMVRQAEVLAAAGVSPQEAVQHGEQALTSINPDEVEPLLARLAALADTPTEVVDLYERQIGRCKGPVDRLKALARAARVAGKHKAIDRARTLFDLALGGVIQDDTVSLLEAVAHDTDVELGGTGMRRALAEALAAGGQGSRDGGKTRGAVLGRAAEIAFSELKDANKGFTWVGDALVAHVEDVRLDQVEDMAERAGDLKRAEAVLSRALEEVFDGPLVRKLLARRAALRRDRLKNRKGAAADLKRLHDLSPGDADVSDQLAELYTKLKDFRGMVQLYEDQILRGKDQEARAELAREVARLWEDKLDDAREAADAWRRVLRMKSGDTEAQEGLERAKANMLKPQKAKPPPEPEEDAEEDAEEEVAAEDAAGPASSERTLAEEADEPRAPTGEQAKVEPASPAEQAAPAEARSPEPAPGAAVAPAFDVEPASDIAPLSGRAARAVKSSPLSTHGRVGDTPPSDDAWGDAESAKPPPVKKVANVPPPPPVASVDTSAAQAGEEAMLVDELDLAIVDSSGPPPPPSTSVRPPPPSVRPPPPSASGAPTPGRISAVPLPPPARQSRRPPPPPPTASSPSTPSPRGSSPRREDH